MRSDALMAAGIITRHVRGNFAVRERREQLETLLAKVAPPVDITPMTRDRTGLVRAAVLNVTS
jgi:hypothetical protein